MSLKYRPALIALLAFLFCSCGDDSDRPSEPASPTLDQTASGPNAVNLRTHYLERLDSIISQTNKSLNSSDLEISTEADTDLREARDRRMRICKSLKQNLDAKIDSLKQVRDPKEFSKLRLQTESALVSLTSELRDYSDRKDAEEKLRKAFNDFSARLAGLKVKPSILVSIPPTTQPDPLMNQPKSLADRFTELQNEFHSAWSMNKKDWKVWSYNIPSKMAYLKSGLDFQYHRQDTEIKTPARFTDAQNKLLELKKKDESVSADLKPQYDAKIARAEKLITILQTQFEKMKVADDQTWPHFEQNFRDTWEDLYDCFLDPVPPHSPSTNVPTTSNAATHISGH